MSVSLFVSPSLRLSLSHQSAAHPSSSHLCINSLIYLTSMYPFVTYLCIFIITCHQFIPLIRLCIIYIFICVYICSCGYVCVREREREKERSTSNVFPNCFLPTFPRQGFIERSLLIWLSWLAIKPHGAILLCLFSFGLQVCVSAPGFFSGAGDLNAGPMLLLKLFTPHPFSASVSVI